MIAFNKIWAVILVVTIVLVSGCSSINRPQTNAEANIMEGVKPKDNHGTERTRNDTPIVRYISTQIQDWDSQPTGVNFSDLYTQFNIIDASETNSGIYYPKAMYARNYEKEDRNWLYKWLANKTQTVTSIANINISAPNMQLAVPLYSVSHASGYVIGNTWSTNYTASGIASPLFLIGPNTSISIKLNVKTSNDLQSQGAGLVVNAVTNAVKIAAPSSSLLTNISKDSISNSAQAVDSSISKLFSNTITEDIDLGRLADTWKPTSYILLTGCAPGIKTDGDEISADGPLNSRCSGLQDLDGSTDVAVGSWMMSLMCPRVSAFFAGDICHTIGEVSPETNIHQETTTSLTSSPPGRTMIQLNKEHLEQIHTFIASSVSNTTILNFPLSSQVSVATFAQSQAWYTTFIKNKMAYQADDYTAFCSNALLSFAQLGLSQFDSALALRAILEDMPGVVSINTAIVTYDDKKYQAGKSCRTLLTSAGVKFHSL